MSYDWREFLTLAQYLNDKSANNEVPEACYRTAASRAYYATFHSCVVWAKEQTGYSGYGHEAIQRYYSVSQDPNERDIGKNLGRMLGNRNSADYKEILHKSPQALSEETIVLASRTLEIIDRLSGTSAT